VDVEADVEGCWLLAGVLGGVLCGALGGVLCAQSRLVPYTDTIRIEAFNRMAKV